MRRRETLPHQLVDRNMLVLAAKLIRLQAEGNRESRVSGDLDRFNAVKRGLRQ